jgi:hypothetical protein
MRKLYLCDARDGFERLEPGSISLIYTDPPYPRKMAQVCYQILADCSYRVLEERGSLIMLAPHYLLAEIVVMMTQSQLKYRWIYDQDQEASSHPRMLMGIEVCWKPLLHYVKGGYPAGGGFMRDKIIIPAKEKKLHEWQQHEWQQSTAWAEYYVKKVAKGVVLDPYFGAGTVGVVCDSLGLSWIGFENDPKAFEIAAKRLNLRGGEMA